MNDLLIILTPLIVLLILVLIRFTACSSFGAAEPPVAAPAPPPSTAPPIDNPIEPPVVPPPKTYAELVVSTKGFAAHWPLDETGGNQVTMLGPWSSTLCQYVPTGTVGRTLGQPGKIGRAPELHGTESYVEVPFIPALNPQNTLAFSVELWVKPNPALGDNTQVLISSHHFDDERGYEILLYRERNQPHQLLRGRVFSSGAAALSEVTIQPALTDGDPTEWRYIVMTYEGNTSGAGTLTLHLRFASKTQWMLGSKPGAVYAIVNSASSATLRFGSSHKSGQDDGNFFAGQIDEVAFYNAALTQGDRDAHFAMA